MPTNTSSSSIRTLQAHPRSASQLVDKILNRALFTSITTWLSTTRTRRSKTAFAPPPDVIHYHDLIRTDGHTPRA